ncbi:MAG: hypothetical protein CMK54_01290 [Proteobacteria bacterium]|nr:hypothetical protein [Pseudomonadota bacterium]
MVLDWFKNEKDEQESNVIEAQKEFELACSETHEDKKSRANRVRIGLRCRAVIDKIFIEGAEQFERYHNDKLQAIWDGNSEPKTPVPKNFQIIKSSKGDVLGYIPIDSAKQIYDIASDFQTKKISKKHAIGLTQLIADNICNMLGLETSFNVLDFLKDKGEE